MDRPRALPLVLAGLLLPTSAAARAPSQGATPEPSSGTSPAADAPSPSGAPAAPAGAVAAPAPTPSAASASQEPTAAPAPTVPATSPSHDPTAGPLETVRGQALGVELAVAHFRLGNGLRVYVVEDHSVPTFALSVAYGVGSRDEALGRTGFAHLFEHMMFKGSENVADGGQFKYVSGAGGLINGYTVPDYTMYFEALPSNHLEPMLWMEADRMRSLDVTEETFENQRSAVLEEMAMRLDNVPYAKAFATFMANAWKGTPYGHPTIGSKEDLLAATTQDVKAFFEQHYTPNNAVLAIVGDVDPEEVRRLTERYFGEIAPGPAPAPFGAIDHTQAQLVEKIADPLAQQPVYALGWKTVPQNHPDRHALTLLFDILVRGSSSKITKILVDERQLAIASIPLGAGGGRDAGSEFAAFIPASGVSFDQIFAVVTEQIDLVKKRGITTKDLKKAINQRTADAISDLATNVERALQVASGALLEDDPLYVLRDLDRLQAVTPADIKRVAEQYLTENYLRLEIEARR